MSKASELKKLREKRSSKIGHVSFEKVSNDTLEDYYNNIITDEQIEKSVKEYEENFDKVLEQFEKQTGLQGWDLGFLFVAVMLQCTRIYVINPYIEKHTQIEKANTKGGREDDIKKFQDKVFKAIADGDKAVVKPYYASYGAILHLRGVPYDITKFTKEKNKYFLNHKLFEKANHRFVTLGHDPLLGLVVGTANILTSTITVNYKLLPVSHHVVYDENLNDPRIDTEASTIKMLKEAVDRSEDEKSFIAAILKQLIHLASDMYTPCGIQLPGASLVLSRKNVETLTKYISTGDVLKATASAGIAELFNRLVAVIHGCQFIQENNDLEENKDLYAVRTKKIILYSNIIASYSNVIQVALSNGSAKLDVGGLAVTMYHLFNDVNFIDKVKYEFINSELNKIYEDKVKDIDKYYE